MNKIVITVVLSFFSMLSMADDLMSAIDTKDNAKLEQAIKSGSDLNKVYPKYGGFKNMSPVVWSVKKKNEAALQALLSAGANANSTGGEFGTSAAAQVATTSSLSTSTMLSMLDSLVKNGADLKLKDKYGSNSLHSAAYTGRKEVVEYLIKAGVPIVKNSDGQTPYDIANMFGKKDVMALLKKG